MYKIPKLLNTFIILNACTIATCRADFTSTIAEIGDFTQVIVPAYAAGMAVMEDGWDGVKQFAFAFTATEIAVGGLKGIVHETRPDGSNQKSFPSGHTAAAFSGATFIHKRYGLKQAVVPYILAGFTGYSRIQAKKHYFHDVVAGAAISSLATWFFVSKYGDVRISADPEEIKLNYSVKF